MNRLVVPSLLLIALVAYACGPRARSADADRKKTVEGPPIAAHLDVKVQGAIQLAFRVTNNELRKVELLFPSGQTHDFVVLDSIGREMWRWSEGRMFTQVVQNRLLDSSASMAFEAECRSELPPGRYTAVATLLSDNKPLEQRVNFEVR
jgi:hypothetical protein